MITVKELLEIDAKNKAIAKSKFDNFLKNEDTRMTSALIERAKLGLRSAQFHFPRQINDYTFTSYEMLCFLRGSFPDFTINESDYPWENPNYFYYDFDW